MKYLNSVKKVRIFRRKTVEELAHHCNVKPAYIYAIQRGDRRLNSEILQKLAELLSVSTDLLLQDPQYVMLGEVVDHNENCFDMLAAFRRLTPKKQRATITFINSMTEASS